MGQKAKRGLGVLKSFLNGVKLTYGEYSIGLDIEPEQGAADSGDIEIDLPPLFVSIAEAAQERKVCVAVLIDEIHYFDTKELGALIMAMHKVQQRQLPLVMIGAGLPILPALAGDSKSYAERLFGFPIIGALSSQDAAKALVEPAREANVLFEASAVEDIFRLTQGYPYFLQEWGYFSWNEAVGNRITLDAVQKATAVVIPRLDQDFFRVRFNRLTPSEKAFLRAMADIGPGPYRTGDIADRLRTKVTSLGPRRSKLIEKGMIYSPAHGELAFTVPLFDEFLKRAMPEHNP